MYVGEALISLLIWRIEVFNDPMILEGITDLFLFDMTF